MALIRFLGKEWKSTANYLMSKSLFISCDGECWKLTKDGVGDVLQLKSDQEEVDTRMLLHAKHAQDEGLSKILIEVKIQMFLFWVSSSLLKFRQLSIKNVP